MNTTLVFAANSLVMIPLTTLKSFVIEIISFLVGTEMGNPFLINLFGIVLTLVNTIYISVAFNRGKGTGTTGIASAKGFENKHHEEGALELLDLLFGKMTENGVGSDSPIQPSHTALKAMCTPDTTCACDVLRQSSKAKFTTAHFSMLLVTIFFFPSTAAAMAISPGFRVIAGIGASGTAIAVIPFRTLPGVDDKMWIITYIAWAAFYSGYLGMQLLLIPSQMSHRRKGFLFCVIIAAVRFSIGLAQTSTTLADAFTLFGPLIVTLCTFVVSLIFEGGCTDVDANTRRALIRVACA